jgi:hypothetical protein
LRPGHARDDGRCVNPSTQAEELSPRKFHVRPQCWLLRTRPHPGTSISSQHS